MQPVNEIRKESLQRGSDDDPLSHFMKSLGEVEIISDWKKPERHNSPNFATTANSNGLLYMLVSDFLEIA